MVIRYDKAFIQDLKETDEGYLIITTCPITRSGVFPYRRTDGELSMEAKLPDELFSKTAVLSVNVKPMTDDHPIEPVTAANYNKYSKDMTHNDAHVLDNKLLISFTITDAETIKKINDGKRELSIGFQVDVAEETGVYSGMQYDSVQRNMQINHIAIIGEGRVGHEVAICGDSAAFMTGTKGKQTGGSNMPKLIIDSKEYKVDPVVKANYDAIQAKLDAAEQCSSNVEKVEGECDALQSQVDNLTKELQTVKGNLLTGDALDKRVQKRVGLVNKAKTFLGDSCDLVGKTDCQIKEAVIAKTSTNFKGDGKSDDYINAYFDSMTAMAAEKGFTVSAVFNDARDKDKEIEEDTERRKNNRLNMNKKKEDK